MTRTRVLLVCPGSREPDATAGMTTASLAVWDGASVEASERHAAIDGAAT